MALAASDATAVATSTSGCCLADCPLVVQSCAADAVTSVTCSGHGKCLAGTGTCACFAGYAGDACDRCTSNYIAMSTSSGRLLFCVFLAGSASSCYNGVRDGVEMGVDCGGVCPACVGDAAGSSTQLPVDSLLTFGYATALIAVLPTVGVVICLTRRFRSRRQRVGAHCPDRTASNGLHPADERTCCREEVRPAAVASPRGASGRSRLDGGTGSGVTRAGTPRPNGSNLSATSRRQGGQGWGLGFRVSSSLPQSPRVVPVSQTRTLRVMPWGTDVTSASSESHASLRLS